MTDARFMRFALHLARRGHGATSPNPMVGAVMVKSGRIIGRGWHRWAGAPHAEIEALLDAQRRGTPPRGATLYVTLEPCSTHGRTPPCTDALIGARVRRVVVGATDPNPKHAGRGLRILRRTGIQVVRGVLADECSRLNEAFNHWIVHGTPFVTVKAAMTLDGKIATASGESKWITGEKAREHAMRLRQGSDAILVGINTVLADDPSLTVRIGAPDSDSARTGAQQAARQRRIVLDARARTPLTAKVVSDAYATLTTVVVSRAAPKSRVAALRKHVNVLVAPHRKSSLRCPTLAVDLRWLLRQLGRQGVVNLLVEGGGEVHGSFLLEGLSQRVVFFYAPMILGGRNARKAVAGAGARSLIEALRLKECRWRRLGHDLSLTARVVSPRSHVCKNKAPSRDAV